MRKVLLIQPPSNIMANRKESKPALPPLGLAYLAGILRIAGCEVEIYDMQAEGYYKERDFIYNNEWYIEYGSSEEDLINKLDEFKPNIVGVSCICSLRHFQACNVVKTIRWFSSKIIIVMGGNHPSSFPERVLKDCEGSLDYIITGEGEMEFLELLNNYPDHKIINNKYQINIDSLPFPAHDLLPLDKYIQIWNDTQYHFYGAKKYVIMNTSRGCINKCEHCPHELIFGKGWRGRSIEGLMNEIEWVVNDLGVEEIQFHEYNGQVDKKFMIELSKRIKKYNIRWGFPIGMWIKLLDKELLQLMYDSGMDYINLAIESQSSDVLDTMPGKDVDLSYVNNVIKWCNDIGYYINGFFMIGYPDQTIKEMWDTVKYAINLNINTAVFFIVQPLPKTPLWNKVKFIDNFHPFMLRYGKCNIKSELWKPEEVEFIRHKGRELFIKSRLKKNTKLRGKNFIL